MMHHLSTLTSFGLAFILVNARHSHGQELLRGGKLPTLDLELASTKNLEDEDTYLQRKGKQHKGKAGKARILPLDIPLDRAYDVQWNPPGYPELRTWGLAPPFYDQETARDGHYTFAKQNEDGAMTMSLVRQKPDGTVCSVFNNVEFQAISETVLMTLHDEYHGTLIKGKGIPAGDGDGVYDTAPVDSVEIAEQWLIQNFQQKGKGAVATKIDVPIMSCSGSESDALPNESKF